MSLRTALGLALALAAGAVAVPGPAPALDDEALGFEITPPRLSFADGSVSFLRAGGDEWSPARVNTPLAAGDELFSAEGSNLELQIGARAYVRGGENTQVGLTSLEPDFLQFRLTSGHLSLDLRSLKAGQTIEVGTPNAAFTVERTGYYRVEVTSDTTRFTSRRGGSARVTPASGVTAEIAANEQVLVRGGDDAQLETYAAPELDAWDRWNYARTDDQLDAVSARYVSNDVYGIDDLDQHGDWRVVPTYGSVWVPRRVAAGWVPYSTGTWLHDPYYGWSWVDDAPWGWAPYHYGRWVYVSGFWGWYPGPVVARPYYAPALVAFYGSSFIHSYYSTGPSIGWVALGWGEPLYPWWGPRHFRHRPCWTGWHGHRDKHWDRHDHHGGHHGHGGGHDRDRDNFRRYKNARVKDAIVAVDRDHFGRRGRDGDGRHWRAREDQMRPVDRDLDVTPDASSRIARRGRAERPPQEWRDRRVVATRAPSGERGERAFAQRGDGDGSGWRLASRGRAGTEVASDARTRVVQPKRALRDGRRVEASRPPFGRSDEERRIPPRFERGKRNEVANEAGERWRDQDRGRSRERDARVETARRAAPAPPARLEQPTDRRAPEVSRDRGERIRSPREQARELPGEPANRVWRRGNDRGGDLPRVDAAPPRVRAQERVQRPNVDASPRWSQRSPQREAVSQPRVERSAPRVERSAPRVERSAPRVDSGRSFDGRSSGGSWQRGGNRGDGGNASAGGGRSRGGDGGGRGGWQGSGRGGGRGGR
jgi:hypothetical protein